MSFKVEIECIERDKKVIRGRELIYEFQLFEELNILIWVFIYVFIQLVFIFVFCYNSRVEQFQKKKKYSFYVVVFNWNVIEW